MLLVFSVYNIYNFLVHERSETLDKRKIIYYENELSDEFSETVLERPTIDENYVYCNDSKWRCFTHFFWYRVIAMPLAFLYTKTAFHHKIVGEEVLKPYRNSGYFMYGNHTQDIGDALMPNMIEKRKDKYIIVNPANLSVPVVGKVIKSLGALPLPDNLKANKNFLSAIERRIGEGAAIVIYPEAHIWPYYTGIRPFRDASFAYPIRFSVPVFCFTNTYQKHPITKRPKIVTYIDGPFFPDENLSPRESRKKLRNEVYKKMCERASFSNIKVIEYIKKEKKK